MIGLARALRERGRNTAHALDGREVTPAPERSSRTRGGNPYQLMNTPLMHNTLRFLLLVVRKLLPDNMVMLARATSVLAFTSMSDPY